MNSTDRSKLPLTVSLLHGETATSFTSRLAVRNGAKSTRSFCSDMGIDWRQLKAGNEVTVRSIAQLGGVDEAILFQHTPEALNEKSYRVGHVTIKTGAMSRKRLRYCPQCIQNDIEQRGMNGIYQRMRWQVSAFQTCDTHKCFMVEHPEKREAGSVWDFSAQISDHLQKLEVVGLQNDNNVVSALEAYLMERVPKSEGNRWVDGLDHHVVANTSIELGRLIEFGADRNQPQFSQNELVRVRDIGFTVLLKGPEAFRRCLKETKTAAQIKCKSQALFLAGFTSG
ncbi:MAG: TniQ family protein [Paracoccaceae bacterium]